MVDVSASWSHVAYVVEPINKTSPRLLNMMEKVGGNWSLGFKERWQIGWSCRVKLVAWKKVPIMDKHAILRACKLYPNVLLVAFSNR